MSFYINGVFDSQTLTTLKELGITNVGFDFRPRSPNLLTYTELKKFLPLLKDFNASFIFEDDAKTTIDSFLDLIGKEKNNIILQFRDQRPVNFYSQFSHPFEWLFHPGGDWKEMFSLDNLQGVLLPLEWKEYYLNKPSFWSMIEERKIQVHLFADSFKQARIINYIGDLSMAIDLGADVMDNYRQVNQEKLKIFRDWDKKNEIATGQ